MVDFLQSKPDWSDIKYGVLSRRLCSNQDLFYGVVSEEAVCAI